MASSDLPCVKSAVQSASSLDCPMCNAPFEDPRVLQCLHTVCIKCLRTHCTPPAIHCPLCLFLTSSSSLDRLPQNSEVIAQLREARGQASCINCGEFDAIVYCRQCAAPLCSGCDNAIHQQPIFSRHEVSQLSFLVAPARKAALEMRGKTSAESRAAEESAVAPPPCSGVEVACLRHPTEVLSRYCLTCRQSACGTCSTDSHRSHNTQPLGSVAHQILGIIPDASRALEEFVTHVEGGVRNVMHALDWMQSAKQATANHIDSRFNAIVEAVNARRRQLHHDLDTLSARKHDLLEQQRQSLLSQIANASRSTQLAHSLYTAPDHFTLAAFVDISAGLTEYVKFMQAQRLDVDPCVDPDIDLSLGKPMRSDVDDTPPSPTRSSPTGSPLRQLSKHFQPPKTVEELHLFDEIHSFGAIMARTTTERHFTFHSLSDHLGILYFLGTSRGIKLYENPHRTGKAKVTSSTLGYGKLEHVISESRADFCTHNVPNSWICVEVEASIYVKHYSFWHDSFDGEAHFLRNWDLQGWNEELQQWEVLRRHVVDKTIDERNPGAAWQVQGCREEGYRKLRILQTGLNSHGNHYLMISGLEFYGVLLG